MSDVSIWTTELIMDKAHDLGLIAVFPEPNELFLDMDNAPWMYNETVMSIIAEKGYGPVAVLRTQSLNGNWHYIIKLSTNVVPLERLALESTLGSDPSRTALGLINYAHDVDNGDGENNSSVLFELPRNIETIKQFRDAFKAVHESNQELEITLDNG